MNNPGLKDAVTTATVSVIIPAYQREEAIGRAVSSVLAQRGIGKTAIEVVVIDDGSTDNTEAAVKAIAAPAPHRIVYEKVAHIGQPGLVRNHGIERSTGEFIGYCDSDDIWLQHHLATCLRQFELYPDIVMVETWWSFQIREKSLNRWKVEFQKASTDGRTTTTNSRLHRRDVLLRSGLFGNLRWGEDIDLWTRIGFVGPIRRVKIPTTAHAYTRGGDNITFEFCPDIGQKYDAAPGPAAQVEAIADQVANTGAEPAPEDIADAAVAPRVIEAPLENQDAKPANLSAGMSVSGAVTSNLVGPGTIKSFGIFAGTHQGSATGVLTVELAVGDRSARGEISLEGASDNDFLTIPLLAPLRVSGGDTIHYTISHPAGSDVAIWLWPTRSPGLQLEPYEIGEGRAARWLLQYFSAHELIPQEVPALPSRSKLRRVARRIVALIIPARVKRSSKFRRFAGWLIRHTLGS